jgi:hypothetical protein
MGELYTNFVELKKASKKDWFTDKIGLVKFEHNNQNYEIYFTRKRANKYSIILGKPNSIIGLDEGNFRSVHKYDENYINVMSEARFKELSLQSD